MKINILTLPSTECLAVGEGSLGNWAQLKIGEEPKDSEFDERAIKEFRAELMKTLKKATNELGAKHSFEIHCKEGSPDPSQR